MDHRLQAALQRYDRDGYELVALADERSAIIRKADVRLELRVDHGNLIVTRLRAPRRGDHSASRGLPAPISGFLFLMVAAGMGLLASFLRR